jgi:hypothetical protein
MVNTFATTFFFPQTACVDAIGIPVSAKRAEPARMMNAAGRWMLGPSSRSCVAVYTYRAPISVTTSRWPHASVALRSCRRKFQRRESPAPTSGANLKDANCMMPGSPVPGPPARSFERQPQQANLSRAILLARPARRHALCRQPRRGKLAGADLAEALMGAARMTRSDLTKRPARCRLRKSRVAEAILIGADLSGAAFDFAFMRGARLDGALLRETRLIGAELIDASLVDADLTEADALGANLRGADLSRATLARTSFRKANMYETKLDGAVFRDTVMPDGTTQP